MAIRTSESYMKTYYTVLFEEMNKPSGKLVRRVTSYCEDPEWFRKSLERRGGRIIHIGAARQVETIDVGF